MKKRQIPSKIKKRTHFDPTKHEAPPPDYKTDQQSGGSEPRMSLFSTAPTRIVTQDAPKKKIVGVIKHKTDAIQIITTQPTGEKIFPLFFKKGRGFESFLSFGNRTRIGKDILILDVLEENEATVLYNGKLSGNVPVVVKIYQYPDGEFERKLPVMDIFNEEEGAENLIARVLYRGYIRNSITRELCGFVVTDKMDGKVGDVIGHARNMRSGAMEPMWMFLFAAVIGMTNIIARLHDADLFGMGTRLNDFLFKVSKKNDILFCLADVGFMCDMRAGEGCQISEKEAIEESILIKDAKKFPGELKPRVYEKELLRASDASNFATNVMTGFVNLAHVATSKPKELARLQNIYARLLKTRDYSLLEEGLRILKKSLEQKNIGVVLDMLEYIAKK